MDSARDSRSARAGLVVYPPDSAGPLEQRAGSRTHGLAFRPDGRRTGDRHVSVGAADSGQARPLAPCPQPAGPADGARHHGSFEFVREAVRKPFVIANYLYDNSLYVTASACAWATLGGSHRQGRLVEHGPLGAAPGAGRRRGGRRKGDFPGRVPRVVTAWPIPIGA